jgi:gamma-glutamyltranspeptidase / glutathione hydrolase
MPDEPIFTTRPVLMGRRGVIASGHYLGARAGQLMFDKGGNAIDAAVASGLALTLLEPQSCGIGGEVPILIYHAGKKQVYSISGQGWIGRAATIDWFRKAKVDPIPGDGFLPATVPAAFGTFAFALMRFGTRTLGDVLEPAIDYAESGFAVYPGLRQALVGLAKKFRGQWPASAALYLPNSRVPEVGELLRNPDWAATLKAVVEVERKERRRGREAAIQAGIDYWYKGPVAERIVACMQKTEVLDASRKRHRGLLTLEDFAEWQPKLEPPVTVRYRGLDVYKCGPWTQGPVFLQQLRLLEGYDLGKLGHNSTAYIHTVIEVAKLAFADRERYYGDPDFVKVPLNVLLSRVYADARRKMIDPKRASMELRPGTAERATGVRSDARFAPEEVDGLPQTFRGDTTHTCAVDAQGNMIAATPSGGWIPSSPLIPGLGFPMGTRGQMFYLDPQHATALAPRKRPRTTLTPSLVLKEGQPYMVFGTPGGDQQDQWTLQFFLNVVDFGMNLQEAIDQPTFHTLHFPSSFYPHDATPGGVAVEGRIPESTRAELAARGHKVKAAGDWAHGKVMAVRLDAKHGVLHGAVSPRGQIGYVSGS